LSRQLQKLLTFFLFKSFPILDTNGVPSPVKTLNFQADLNGITTYSVYSSVQKISDTFAISTDGNLRVLKKLFQGVDPQTYDVLIQAQDSSSGLTTTANVRNTKLVVKSAN
jgi:hypothetical protein